MAQLTKKEMIKAVEECIKNIENKDFKVFFYVLDTKNNPSGSLEYIYSIAMSLSKMGYNVEMLHMEEDFVGVGDWLGQEYANLTHRNVKKENVEISASDFLFIPEIFANVMVQAKNLPCKKIMITKDYNFITEFMPVGVRPSTLNISDAIVTTKSQEEKLLNYFPEIRTHIVSPCIQNKFRPNNEPRKLIINIVSKDQSDVNRILKPFYWKHENYKWVGFRDLRGLSQETFCDALREAFLTIWIDEKSNFGFTPLEALRCGNVVVCKTTDVPSDWMVETLEDGSKTLTDACVWFDDIDSLPDMIASIVRTWTLDKMPQGLLDAGRKFDTRYTHEQQDNDINKSIVKELFEKRVSDLKEFLIQLKNNNDEEKESK